MEVTKLYILAGLFLTSAGIVFAAQEKAINPYAVTANRGTLSEPSTLQIDAAGTTVLSPNFGQLSDEIRPVVKNYMMGRLFDNIEATDNSN